MIFYHIFFQPYIMNMSVCFIPPYTPLLYSKTGVYKGLHYFHIFALKHILCTCTHKYVLSKNMKTKFLNVKLVLLSDTYLIIIFAICHCHSFKNELVLVLNTAWRKQPIADYVSNHNRTCGKSVSENSE